MNKILILFFVIFISTACSKDNSIALSNNENIGTDQLDSFKISSSTILLDSLPTSGQDRILIGSSNDDLSGKTTAESYFQIDLGSVTAPDINNTVFDSINLVLYYDKYYYGDTTKSQTIYVHKLTKNIVLEDIPTYLDEDEKPVFVSSSALYNTSSVAYQTTPIASITYKPTPNKVDSLNIKLPYEMGKEWFNLITNKSTTFTNSEAFLEYFKGLALISNEDNENIIGFRNDSLSIKLNYSYSNVNGLKSNSFLKFDINTDLQYNKIKAYRTNTSFDLLSNKNEISATASNNKTLIQSGIGAVTKIRFPSLLYYLESSENSINKAELRIPVEASSTNYKKLPQKLVVMLANKNNVPQSLLTSFDVSTETQYAYLTQENNNQNKYYYSFNITKSLSEISEMEKNNKPLLISYPLDNLFNTAEQAFILNNQTDKIKLIITYTKF